MTNAVMFHDSHFTDLSIPDGKYFLADAGFPTCSTLLVLYCGPQYHLAEWSHAQLWYVLLFCYFLLFSINFFSPATCEELFNLQHAKAQNVIKRLFGVLK